MEHTLLSIGFGDRLRRGILEIGPHPGADLTHFATAGIPFPTGSVRGIAVRDVIERLPRAEAIVLLRECRRVLAHDGVLRIAVPDLDATLARYRDDTWRDLSWTREPEHAWMQTRCDFLNFAIGQWACDLEELERLAMFVGMTPLGRRDPGTSGLAEFTELTGGADTVVLEFSPVSRPLRRREDTPLVSVVIPSHNPNWLSECIDSVLAQTYRNLEIIVSDNRDDDAIEKVMAGYLGRDPRIRYHRRPDAATMHENFATVFELARGEYVKYLCDDDFLHPRCVQRLVEVLNQNPGVTVVTSHRQYTDVNGNPIPDLAFSKRVVQVDSVLDGMLAADLVVSRWLNFIGEPTAVLFRRADAAGVRPNPFCVGGFQFRFAVDVALYLNLLSQGDLAYLVETLSYVRRYPEQGQQDPTVRRINDEEEGDRIKFSRRMGFVTRQPPRFVAVAPLIEEDARPDAPVEAAELPTDEPGPDAAPLEIGDARDLRLLCIPDWEHPGWKDAFSAYLQAFGPNDPVTLILRVEPTQPEVVERAVRSAQQCLFEAGIEEANAPDIVFEASDIPAGRYAGLFTAASALLPVPGVRAERHLQHAATCGIPVLAASDPQGLRSQLLAMRAKGDGLEWLAEAALV